MNVGRSDYVWIISFERHFIEKKQKRQNGDTLTFRGFGKSLWQRISQTNYPAIRRLKDLEKLTNVTQVYINASAKIKLMTQNITATKRLKQWGNKELKSVLFVDDEMFAQSNQDMIEILNEQFQNREVKIETLKRRRLRR